MGILHDIISSIYAFLRLVVIGLVMCLAVIIAIPIGMTLIGYRVNASSEDLAKEAVKKGDPTLCWKIFNYGFLGPSTGESRSHCVHTYAKIAKNPSACELLMPSIYGLSCVGVAETSLPCDVESTAYSVYWRDDNIEHTEGVRSCMQPNKNRSPFGNQCCLIAQVAWLKDKNDCSSLKSNIPVYDHCLYALAWKSKNPTYCEGITSANPRSACLVQTRALQKDPSICTGCTPPVENVEQLPKE